ncbi:cancer-related nucleoside-triphosphatase isoform X3 [Pteropus alecto]|uniref:cancer-related nucleoside-triphosphatase isoform X3 n=1 Tax=Pteropus alecto TaxID=9402 RepID=UPI000D538580|nr:cancer-related nucleoside-triphosphatase isoform X3 [Pteropus alecto]
MSPLTPVVGRIPQPSGPWSFTCGWVRVRSNERLETVMLLKPRCYPGVGKTTLIQKASAALQSSGVPVAGFYTEEVRQGGRRIGFDVVTLSGLRGPLSRVGPEPPPGGRGCRVGQYVVDLTSFEQLALPALSDVSVWLLPLSPPVLGAAWEQLACGGAAFALKGRSGLHLRV